MSKDKEIVYIEEYKEEVSIYDSIKRVILTGLLPFEYLEDIVIAPDILGPFICILLLSLTNFFYIYMFSYNAVIGYAKNKGFAFPAINISDNTILVYPSNITISSEVLFLKDKNVFLTRIYSDTIMLSLAIWLATFIGMYLSSKVLGGETKSFTYISGYVLSSKIYEYLTRAIITYILLRSYSIKIIVPYGSNVKMIVSYIVAGINKIGEIMLLLKGHQVFFIIWNTIVIIAALNVGGRLSMKRAVIGGIIAYIIAGGLYLLFSRFYNML